MKNSVVGLVVLALLLSACAGTAERGARSTQTAVSSEPSPQLIAPPPPYQTATAAITSPPVPVTARAPPSPAPPIAQAPNPRQAASTKPAVTKSALSKPAPKPPSSPKPNPAKATAARSAIPAPAVAPAASLSGTVGGRFELSPGGQQSVEPGEVAEGLIYFLPQAGAPRPKPGRFNITTQSKGFTPNLLIVPVGSTVAFPNTDTILHSVYSRTPGSNFDLKTYGPGQSRQTVLNQPGLVIVNCNVHHNMRANIVVLATPYFTRPSADGSFRLNGLPTGPGTLVFWHPRANALSQVVQIGATGSISKTLTASRPRIDAHMQGKP